MNKIKLSSFNVNSVRARLNLLEAWFSHRNNDLDILCMQELKTEESGFPFDFFKNYGFICYLNAQKRYNGVSICTKIDAEEVQTVFDNEILNHEKRMIYARFPGFHLINIYAPHGDLRGTEKFYFKMKWYDALLEWLSSNFDPQSDKLILTGDFNVTFDDRDVYDPVLLADTIGTMPEEREKLRQLLEWGLYDAWKLKYADVQQFTWWDYQGAKIWKNQGMRIDFVLLSPPMAAHLIDIEVDMWARRKNKITPSDHAPVVAVFSKPE